MRATKLVQAKSATAHIGLPLPAKQTLQCQSRLQYSTYRIPFCYSPKPRDDEIKNQFTLLHFSTHLIWRGVDMGSKCEMVLESAI